ncbi:MAG: FecR family protein [Acidobacteriota bacterium]
MKLANQGRLLSSVSVGFFSAALLLSTSQTVNAQYLISTRAGFINRVEGKVLIQRQENGEADRGRASLGTQMNDGDLLITQAGAHAEILLTPGSYLRLAENTEVRAVRTSLQEPRFALVKGSVIIETAQMTKGTAIQLDTANGPVSVAKEGLQRIDAAGGGTKISVRQGEVFLGNLEQALSRNVTKVGRGKMIDLGASSTSTGPLVNKPLVNKPLVNKIDKDANADDFDLWSFNRAQTLMAANSHALRRSQSLMNGSMSLGWYFDPFFNCYTFIPGTNLAYSPYGFPYFRRYSDYYYYFPYGYSYYGYPQYWGGGGGNSGGGGGGGSTPSRIIAGSERTPVRREMEGRAVRNASSSDSPFSAIDRGASSSPSSSGSSVSAPSAPVSVSAGASRGDSGGGSSGASRPSRP